LSLRSVVGVFVRFHCAASTDNTLKKTITSDITIDKTVFEFIKHFYNFLYD
jgi:hypothetical protein